MMIKRFCNNDNNNNNNNNNNYNYKRKKQNPFAVQFYFFGFQKVYVQSDTVTA